MSNPILLADVGNSRLKLAQRADNGSLGPVTSLDVRNPDSWLQTLTSAGLLPRHAHWHISTVRPAASDTLRSLLSRHGSGPITVYQSAADVPVPNTLREPGRTGADRALAVFEALALAETPLTLVLCGTAITVESIDEQGIWRGGAIAPGLGPMAEALNHLTAQLPEVNVYDTIIMYESDYTEGAIEAGLYWSLVGAVRELTTRPGAADRPPVRILWTGGDAPWLARQVAGPTAWIEPDLVLRGLARLVGRRPSTP